MENENRPMELETVIFGNSTSPKTSMELPEDLLSVGDILCDTYILRTRLGRGGMGEIWKADEVYEGEILRTVVIKTLAPNVQNVQEELARIQSMFHKIHSLQHQHICPMYAMKNDPKAGTIIVMKFIDGMMLQEYYAQFMRLHDDFPVSEVVRLLMPIAQALDYSHSKKVLHRDVKPQNILVSKDESDGVQLIDFGLVMEMRSSIASNTSTHFDGSGTLPYMSPEQWSGDFQDAKADQFSLAVVVYELLAGKLPFYGTNIQVLGFQILNKSPEPILNVPDYVNFALQKALAKDRKQRFNTCVDFINALEKPVITDGVAVSESAGSASDSVSEAAPQSALSSWAASGSFLPMVIGGGVALLLVLIIGVLILLALKPTETVVFESNPENQGSGARVFDQLPPGLSAPVLSARTDEEKNEKKNEKKAQSPAAPKTPAPKKASVPETNAANQAPVTPAEPAAPAEPASEKAPESGNSTPDADPQPADSQPTDSQPADSPSAQPEPLVTDSEASPAVTRTPEEWLAAARQAYQSDDAQAAREAFAAVELTNLTAEDLTHYAELCRKAGLFETATRIRERQLEESQTPELLLSAIEDAIQATHFRHAYEWSELFLKQDPKNEKVLQAEVLALTQIAGIVEEAGPARHALELCNQLLAEKPEDASLLASRGFIYLKNPAAFSKSFDLAKADLEKALTLDPNCVSALNFQGILLRDVFTQKMAARRNFEKVLQLEPENSEALLQMGLTLAAEKPALALDFFTRFLKLLPERWEVYEYRGKLYLEQNQLPSALEDFNRCLTINEKDFHVRYLRAQTKTKLEFWRDAKEDYDFLLANDAELRHQVDYYLGLASVYEGANQKKKAQDARNSAERIRRKTM